MLFSQILEILIPVMIFAFPLTLAALAGRASAEDPSHRVTPLRPWIFFRRAAFYRLRWWFVIWVLYLAVFGGQIVWDFFVGKYRFDEFPLVIIMEILATIFCVIVALFCNIASAALLFSRRIRNFWGLFFFTAFCGTASTVALVFFFVVVLGGNRQGFFFFFLPFPISVAALSLVLYQEWRLREVNPER